MTWSSLWIFIHGDDCPEGLGIWLECEGASSALPEEPARKTVVGYYKISHPLGDLLPLYVLSYELEIKMGC